MARNTLQTLPAELRNNIYELVFASHEEEPVDICKAAPPAQDIIFTCKQIYNEAAGMYRDKCRGYWSSTAFHLDTGYHISDEDRDSFEALCEEDMEHITKFTVISKRSTYELENGGWNYTKTSPGFPSSIHRYRAEKFVESCGAVKFEEWCNGLRLYEYGWTPTGERVWLKEQIDQLGFRLNSKWRSSRWNSST